MQSEYLARDAYPTWKRKIRAASQSVIVLTPYFDRSLVRLVQNSSLPSTFTTVVTDLEPNGQLTDYRAQLRAARQLLELGVNLRTLSRLHAKVLLVDEHQVVIGSQNSTAYARRSRETSAAPQATLAGSAFVSTILEWVQLSEPVDEDLLEHLLDTLDVKMSSLATAARELREAYIEAVTSHARMRRPGHHDLVEPRFQQNYLLRNEESIGYRQAAGTAFATIRTVYRDSWSTNVDSYQSLIADGGVDLTRWIRRNGVAYRIPRLSMFPIIRADNGQMAFGRIARTRVTYIRKGVRWNRSTLVAGRTVQVTIRFPEKGLDRSNIELVLTPTGAPHLQCVIGILFDGEQVHLQDATSNHPSTAAESSSLGGQSDFERSCRQEMANVLNRRKLLQAYLSPFHYSELGIENTNAGDFFDPRPWYQLGLADLDGAPVLVARPLS